MFISIPAWNERAENHAKLPLIFWKEARFWLGKLKEHPEIMTQGKTVEELEENLRDAYPLVMDDVFKKDAK